MFLRIGYDEIQDDPFHPKQTGFEKPKKSQFAIHATGYLAADSNAGHSEDLGLGGGYLSTFNANSQYGNVLISSVFNPYLSAAGVAPVSALYYQAGLDFQYRMPVADTTFTMQGQAMIGHYNATVPNPTNYETPVSILGKPEVPGKQYALNIGGGEFMASIGDKPWEFAGRFAVVIPDVGMVGTYVTRHPNGSAAATLFAPVFMDSSPIYELTFPSITWHMNNDCKLVAETMFMIDTPAVRSDDGTYLIAEMPGSANSGINLANYRDILVPVGRMMFQFQF